MADWPGRRRSSAAWISSRLRGTPAGQPSITAPSAGPWLSPKVVRRNSSPKVFIVGSLAPRLFLEGARPLQDRIEDPIDEGRVQPERAAGAPPLLQRRVLARGVAHRPAERR